MKVLGILVSMMMMMISALGLSALTDHCLQNPVSNSGAYTQNCETPDAQSDTSGNHQDHCSVHCSHFASLPETDFVMKLDFSQDSDCWLYLFSHSPIVLDGPFRPPLA